LLARYGKGHGQESPAVAPGLELEDWLAAEMEIDSLTRATV
jgi:hypothetical protein